MQLNALKAEKDGRGWRLTRKNQKNLERPEATAWERSGIEQIPFNRSKSWLPGGKCFSKWCPWVPGGKKLRQWGGQGCDFPRYLPPLPRPPLESSIGDVWTARWLYRYSSSMFKFEWLIRLYWHWSLWKIFTSESRRVLL